MSTSTRQATWVLLCVALIGGCTDNLAEPTTDPPTATATATSSLRPTMPSPSLPPTPSATASPSLPPTPSATPIATPTTDPSASASPSPSASAQAAVGLQLDWRRERAGIDDAEIRDSAVIGDRIAVIGTRFDEETGYVAAIWWEDKDLVWREASIPQVGGPGANLYDVTSGGPGLVVVGRYDDWPVSPLVWTSTDGASWSVAHVDVGDRAITLDRVAAAADGLVAFGTEEFGEWETPRSVALVSGDGTAWAPATSQATHDLLPFGAGGVLVGTGKDLTAFVSGQDGRGPVSIWRATGRDDWRRVAELPASKRYEVTAAAAGPPGWVAIGRSARNRLAWFSPDGVDWQRAENAPQLAQAAFADRAGFVVVGWYDPVGGCSVDPTNWRNLTWTSSDGRIWRLVHEMGDGAHIESLRRRGRTLIGVGMIGDADGAVWSARLPDTSSDDGLPPTQSLPETPGGCE